MWNKKIRRVVTWIVVLGLFFSFLNELRIVVLAYRIETIQSVYADADGILYVANNKTPVTKFVFSSVIQLKYHFGAMTDRDYGLIRCYLQIGGEPAETDIVRLGTLTLNAGKSLRKELDSCYDESNTTGVLLTLITNSLGTHLDASYPATYRLSDGTAKFFADCVSFEYEEGFRSQSVHSSKSRADQRISSEVIETLKYFGDLAANRSEPTNHHRLLVEATTITEIAEKYLSNDVEKGIVRHAMKQFLKKVQENPMNSVDSGE